MPDRKWEDSRMNPGWDPKKDSPPKPTKESAKKEGDAIEKIIGEKHNKGKK